MVLDSDGSIPQDNKTKPPAVDAAGISVEATDEKYWNIYLHRNPNSITQLLTVNMPWFAFGYTWMLFY